MDTTQKQSRAATTFFILLVVLAVTVTACFSQGNAITPNSNAIPAGWKVFPAPAENSVEMHSPTSHNSSRFRSRKPESYRSFNYPGEQVQFHLLNFPLVPNNNKECSATRASSKPLQGGC